MTFPANTCPACKREIPEPFRTATDCVFCGVVFAKVGRTRKPMATPEPSAEVHEDGGKQAAQPNPSDSHSQVRGGMAGHVQAILRQEPLPPGGPNCPACGHAAPPGTQAGDECGNCGMFFTQVATVPSDAEIRQILASNPLPPARTLGKPPTQSSWSAATLVRSIEKPVVALLRRCRLHPPPSWLALHHDALVWWARGRMAWPRMLVLTFMLYLAVRYLFNVEHRSIFDGINLGIHEMGHLVFGIFPEFLTFLGGTLLQLAAPVICGLMLYRQGDFFGVSFCGCWLGSNFYNVAIYQADAQAQLLPLVTMGGGVPIHDWNYMLTRLGLLEWDSQVAFLTRVVAFVVMWLSVHYGSWVVATLLKAEAPTPQAPPN